MNSNKTINNENEFSVIIASKEDFTVNDDYNKANDAQKAYIWEYSKRKMSDIIMQDFWDALDICVNSGLEYYKEFYRIKHSEKCIEFNDLSFSEMCICKEDLE